MPDAAEEKLPIPCGWYCVGWSSELAAGEVRAVRYFGLDLVLFRTEGGEAALAVSSCPHAGLSLDRASVEGERLRCPVHQWEFDTAGRCAAVPWVKEVPASMQAPGLLPTLPVAEHDGFIWAWYHGKGAAPRFPVKTFEEIASGGWTDCRRDEWTISTQVQETGENAVDSAHFLAVHGVPDLLGRPDVRFEGHLRISDLAMELTRITDASGVEPGRYVDGHILTMSSGPGQTWTRQVGVADLLIIGLPTPIDADTLVLRFACTVPKSQQGRHAKLSHAIIQNAVDQVEQDIPIWEHKKYLPKPLLCDGDGPIAEYRRWFAQFYAD